MKKKRNTFFYYYNKGILTGRNCYKIFHGHQIHIDYIGHFLYQKIIYTLKWMELLITWILQHSTHGTPTKSIKNLTNEAI